MALRGRKSEPSRDTQSLRLQAVEIAIAVAHEPSLGLCYIQQHVQQSTPEVVALEQRLKAQEKEMQFEHEHTTEITGLVRSMKTHGPEACDRIRSSMDRCLLLLPVLAEAQAKQQRTMPASAIKEARQSQGPLAALGKAGSISKLPLAFRGENWAGVNLGIFSSRRTASQPAPAIKAAVEDKHMVPRRQRAHTETSAPSREGSHIDAVEADKGALGSAKAETGSSGPKIPPVSDYEALQKAQMERLQRWLEEDED